LIAQCGYAEGGELLRGGDRAQTGSEDVM
jgi:hypothetical protein